MTDRYYARSASDRTDDWPFWLVADRRLGGVNQTAEVMDQVGFPRAPGQVLCDREIAEHVAARANAEVTG